MIQGDANLKGAKELLLKKFGKLCALPSWDT